MTEFLALAAGLTLAIVAIGLVRLLWGPTGIDRMMAVQLLGTGGAAVALLLAAAGGVPAIVDVALALAVLAAFAAAALGASLAPSGTERGDG